MTGQCNQPFANKIIEFVNCHLAGPHNDLESPRLFLVEHIQKAVSY